MQLPSRRHPLAHTCCLALLLVAATQSSRAAEVQDAAPATDFIRFVEDDKGGGTLQSAIVTYRNREGVTVHLVAALHVAEKSYYRDLADTFTEYDALLYEMVKPKDAPAPGPGDRAGGVVSGFQRFLRDVLELEFQLDAIDYTADNFVHADLDAETFLELQEKRGESLAKLMLRSMLADVKRQAPKEGDAAGAGGAAEPVSLVDLLVAMNSRDSARQYKLLLARQFQDIEAQIAGFEGEGGKGTVILTERNKAALRVLGETVAAGRKRIGVFYGAGHMPGIEKAMVEDMGFERVGTEWRVAWDMKAKAVKAPKKTKPPSRGGDAVTPVPPEKVE